MQLRLFKLVAKKTYACSLCLWKCLNYLSNIMRKRIPINDSSYLKKLLICNPASFDGRDLKRCQTFCFMHNSEAR